MVVEGGPPQEIRQLSVIRKPAAGTRTVLVVREEDGVAMRGDGPLTYVCGGCRTPILVGAHRGVGSDLVLKCKACGVHNEVRRRGG